jgi:hypothetical protein
LILPFFHLERIKEPPRYLEDFVVTIKFSIFLVEEGVENLTLYESISHKKWHHMMQDEYNSILQNNTWSFVPLTSSKWAITCRWFLKIELGISGQEDRYKAHIVARGF